MLHGAEADGGAGDDLAEHVHVVTALLALGGLVEGCVLDRVVTLTEASFIADSLI